jgi:cyclopropane-fatty-acyl-phospholipid synthase
MNSPTQPLDRVLERFSIPAAVLRPAVRAAIAARLVRQRSASRKLVGDTVERFALARADGLIAVDTQAANDQHYEVPPAFFELVLGPRMKYSSGLWTPETRCLAAAEEAMLQLTCQRAQLADGQRILELGCGWGSLTLYMAERFPDAQVTALSNSAEQRTAILARAAAWGLTNVNVITADVNEFALDARFDRIVSVEMFEHVRNHGSLLRRVAKQLDVGGKLFVHVFAHRRYGYEFEDTWMARRFFSGGVMPAHGWLTHVPSPLEVEEQWWLNGRHYSQTAGAWLANFDASQHAVDRVLARAYGPTLASRRRREWRVFFLSIEEIFGFRNGREYGVSHALLRPAPTKAASARSNSAQPSRGRPGRNPGVRAT